MQRCLAIGESHVVRKIVQRVLEGLGMSAEGVASVEAAAPLCKSSRPDLIVFDVQATENTSDITQTLRKLQAMPGAEASKILLLTSEWEVGLLAQAMEAGASAYLPKPFDQAAFLSKIMQMGLIAR